MVIRASISRVFSSSTRKSGRSDHHRVRIAALIGGLVDTGNDYALRTVLSIAIITMLLVAACAGPESPMAGTEWELTATAYEYLEPFYLAPEPPITLKFTHSFQFEGHTGCNSYRGRYALEGEAFEVIDLFKHERACPTDRLLQRESKFLQAFEDAHFLDVDGLESPEGSTMGIETRGGQWLLFAR